MTFAVGDLALKINYLCLCACMCLLYYYVYVCIYVLTCVYNVYVSPQWGTAD